MSTVLLQVCRCWSKAMQQTEGLSCYDEGEQQRSSLALKGRNSIVNTLPRDR